MALTLVDFALAWVSIKDINHILSDITVLLQKIPTNHPLKSADYLEIALEMLDEDAQLSSDASLGAFSVRQNPDRAHGRSSQVHLDPTSEEVGMNILHLLPTMSILTKSPSTSFVTAATVAPAKPRAPRSLKKFFTSKQRKEYVQKTAQVLFTTEFAILIEFTEVIIPFIYSEYLAMISIILFESLADILTTRFLRW
ncbi:unnamed protein product [Phytophthora lilii]|uniref:Unnamed protein product n=1 Tax=Phytophthora lilii TaxID=2077276 RepID=A0A9W6TXG0_9STRA|nr:unnamed protein product [Phytophthora lilii]